MPHDVSHESNGLGVVITLSGVIEADEIYKIDLQLKSDELYLQQRYQIWDFSNAEELNISFDDIRDFAIQDGIAACKNPNQRIALIPRKSSHSDLDQMFHILEGVWSPNESKTFWDVDTAREWAKSGQKPDNRDT